ncbi:hypothetical protein C8J57DRAFT_1563935 [Mycena rebaudengoi]|nr:hypothetical protein C8J57DRAFT_1563935 [Mycena rebaudengoi]
MITRSPMHIETCPNESSSVTWSSTPSRPRLYHHPLHLPVILLVRRLYAQIIVPIPHSPVPLPPCLRTVYLPPPRATCAFRPGGRRRACGLRGRKGGAGRRRARAKTMRMAMRMQMVSGESTSGSGSSVTPTRTPGVRWLLRHRPRTRRCRLRGSARRLMTKLVGGEARSARGRRGLGGVVRERGHVAAVVCVWVAGDAAFCIDTDTGARRRRMQQRRRRRHADMHDGDVDSATHSADVRAYAAASVVLLPRGGGGVVSVRGDVYARTGTVQAAAGHTGAAQTPHHIGAAQTCIMAQPGGAQTRTRGLIARLMRAARRGCRWEAASSRSTPCLGAGSWSIRACKFTSKLFESACTHAQEQESNKGEWRVFFV